MGEPLWGCVYVRREALNIASGARWSFQDREDTSPLRLEEFVLVPGLVHVLAAAVVTRPAGQAPVDVSAPLTPAMRRALADDRGRDRASAGHCRPALLRVPVERYPGPRIESRRVARAAGRAATQRPHSSSRARFRPAAPGRAASARDPSHGGPSGSSRHLTSFTGRTSSSPRMRSRTSSRPGSGSSSHTRT